MKKIEKAPALKTAEEKIRHIASKKMLRIEQWRDGSGSWRAGIEWYSDERLEYMCECPTLDDCLDLIIAYMYNDKKFIKDYEKKAHDKRMEFFNGGR